jgi:hypothetical protein
MRIIAFIEASQGSVIRKILEHCGLWNDPPARSPPRQAPSLKPPPAGKMPPANTLAGSDSGRTLDVDPDFLEHLRRERQDEPELPW